MGGGEGVVSWSMMVGIGDVGSGGVVVTGFGMVESEHAVSAMVRVRNIQGVFFNVENLLRSLTRRARSGWNMIASVTPSSAAARSLHATSILS